jgi:hypothetical protein
MTAAVAHCANCGAPLSGPYCSACGQRALHHILSLREFLAEALEVFTHADSRFWGTFLPLMARPGYLTQQFVAGRRARFLPPFRLYIVLSVLFVLVVSLTASFGTPQVNSTPEARARAAAEVRAGLQAQLQRATALGDKLAATGHGWADLDCSSAHVNGVNVPAWLSERGMHACERIREDHGRELGHSLLHNLGRAMLVLLPLLAALMQLLYWRQHRRYVEHLLLLLHNHACVFLAMSVLLIATRLVPSDRIVGFLVTTFMVYAGWYLFESMRRFYGQGWVATSVKFSVLAVAYVFCAMFMLGLTTLYSAVTL